MEDDCVCDYDSTWDTESDGDDPAGESQTRRSCQDKNKSGWTLSSWHNPSRNMRAAKDMQNYRRGYPNLTDEECSEDKMNNLQFYLNKFPSAPDEVFIESFLRDWKNDYKRLERVHSYIQWLFPLREPGVNYMASELTKKEIEAFRNNEDAKRRLVESYELMLGFYGIRLVNKETGEVKRAENWKERFGNLERNMHNNLRITRILKSLGELGFEHYQAPLVQFFLEETLVKKTLGSVKRSVLDYFLFAVRAKQERKDLLRFAYLNFEPKDKFVWCPRKIQKQFRNMEKKSETAGNGDVKEEANLRGKSKEGEAVVQVKEDGLDNVSKTPKGPDKTPSKDKNKLPEASPEPKPDTEAVENGDAENDSNNKMLNGIDSVEDDGEMDQSHSSETLMGEGKPSAETEEDLTNNPKGIIPETDSSRQTDGDTDTEKPPKKKREDKVLPSNGSAGDFASGQVEEKAGTKKATGQTSPSAQTVPKTSKLTPSDSLGRKIPRTKCSKVLGKKEEEETSQANVSATNGSQTSTEKGVEEQTNDMESVPSSSD